jgi:hypothetical protein
MRGRVAAGKDDMGGSAASRLTSGTSGLVGTTLGAAGGNEALHGHSHANTLSDPTHAHSVYDPGHSHTADMVSIKSGSGGGSYRSLNFYSMFNDINNSGTTNPDYYGAATLYTSGVGTGVSIYGASTGITISNASTGAGSSQNVQPTMVLNYIIKVA